MTDQEQSALIKMQQEIIESLNQLIKTMQKQHEDEMKRQEIIIANLNETINTLKRRMYGSSSEKSGEEQISGQYDFFNEIEAFDFSDSLPEPVEQEVSGYTKKKRPKTTHAELLKDLPSRDVVYTLSGDDQNCPYCGTKMVELGREVIREEIEIIPAKVQKVRHIQVTYICEQCKADDEPTIVKADVPKGLLKHSLASSSAVAHIMTQKFANAQPLYRQEKAWEQMGVRISRATQANWVNYCATEYLTPVYGRMHQVLLEREVIHADETPCQVLKEDGKKARTKSYMWLYRSGNDGLAPIILYEYQPTRGGYHAVEFLKGFQGYLHCDGFSGYNQLKGVTRCGCWAHLRRYFYDAIPASRKLSEGMTPADKGYSFCNELFHIEKQLADMTPEERKERRLELEKPVLKAFWSWLDTIDALGGSRLAKAVNYAQNQRKYMENYLLDGRCSISNNAAENSIRPYTVGRKNFLFHDTVKGAKSSAVIYSLVECAKANNLNIYKYLKTLLDHRMDYKNEPERLDDLMPWSDKIQEECKVGE